MTVAYTCPRCVNLIVYGVAHDCALPERITHGRHCACTACARQDWSEPQLAPCGMHGASCPPVYAPYNVGPDSSGSREAPTEAGVLNAPAPCPAALSGLDLEGEGT